MNTFLNSIFSSEEGAKQFLFANVTEVEAAVAALTQQEAEQEINSLETFMNVIDSAIDTHVAAAANLKTAESDEEKQSAAQMIALSIANTNNMLTTVFNACEAMLIPQLDLENFDYDLEAKDDSKEGMMTKVIKALKAFLAAGEKWLKSIFTQAGRQEAAAEKLDGKEFSGEEVKHENKNGFVGKDVKETSNLDKVVRKAVREQQAFAVKCKLMEKQDVDLGDTVTDLTASMAKLAGPTIKGTFFGVEITPPAVEKPSDFKDKMDAGNAKTLLSLVKSNLKLIKELESNDDKYGVGFFTKLVGKMVGNEAKISDDEVTRSYRLVRYGVQTNNFLVGGLFKANAAFLSIAAKGVKKAKADEGKKD